MYIVNSYTLAIIFCFITMICWGSWGNTQKLASKNWRYELYYWDYTIGILLFALLLVFTLGSFGDSGRGFLEDIQQVEAAYIASALIGGAIFNASNILLSASVSIAGMAVAFPLGVGLALVLGVFINYFSSPKGDPFWLFTGVVLIVIAIICNGIAAGKNQKAGTNNSKKGIILAAIAGILMSFFYRFVAAAMDLNNFESPTTRNGNSLYCILHLCYRNLPKQLPLQYTCDEASVRWSTRHLQGILCRKSKYTHGRNSRRMHLGIRYGIKLHCRRKSGSSHFLCTWTRSTDDCCPLGCFHLERIYR